MTKVKRTMKESNAVVGLLEIPFVLHEHQAIVIDDDVSKWHWRDDVKNIFCVFSTVVREMNGTNIRQRRVLVGEFATRSIDRTYLEYDNVEIPPHECGLSLLLYL